MARLKVVMRDKVGKNFTHTELRRIKRMTELDTERLARECEKIIKDTIMSKSQMPTGKLASKMLAEKIPNGWGVGDIARLDAETPYWNHIDKGSEGIGANWQHYLPRGFWQNGRWVESDTGYYGIQPQSPIPAMHYIANTLLRMQVVEKIILNRK
jgi:hypothetical protein